MTVSEPAQEKTKLGFWRRWSAKAWDYWLEIIGVGLLAFASLAAAWSGYQTASWGGVQASSYSQASAKRIESSRASTNAYIYAMADMAIFNSWANAYAASNQQLMRFYENRFSPQLKVAVDAWLATNPLQNPAAPASPFTLSAYKMPEMERSRQLDAEATALFERGERANANSDDYVQTTVILALVLFFAGIATKVTWRPGRITIVATGSLLLLITFVQLLTLPVD